MCPIYIHYRDIYRWRSASQVQRSYSQNIPGRTRNFPITIVSGLQLRWAPLTQAVFFASTLLFTHLRDVPYFEDGLRLIFGRPAEGPSVLRFDACAIPPSRIFGCLPEEQRRLALSSLVLGLGSSSRAVWSSRSFGDRTEGGVPNSSPSEPRFDLQEGRGFDLVGVEAPPFRLGAATVVGEAQSMSSCTNASCFRRRNKIFGVSTLVRAQSWRRKFWREKNFRIGSLALE